MKPTDAAHHHEPVSVQTSGGRASYLALGPTGGVLEVEYQVPDLEVGLGDKSLDVAISELCEREVQIMRRALGALGEELAALLPDAGKDPVLDRKWRNREERDWDNRAGTFKVLGTGTTLRDQLRHPEGTSEAELVRETVRQMIAQREENIRGIYRTVPQDAGGKRAGDGPATE